MGGAFSFAIGATLAKPNQAQTTPAFSVVDIDGNSVSENDLQGQVSLLYFGFTFCPDICPSTLRNIGDALDLLGDDGERVAVWFITVDPQRDTPEVLREYVDLIDPRIRALTGNEEQLRSITEAFGIVADRHTPAQADPDYYLINHTASTMLIDPQGRLVERIPQDTSSEGFAQRLRRLL